MNDGIAIAARMPMIRITTRSSMSVKPLSSCERWRSRYNIESSSDPLYRAPGSVHRLSRRCVPRGSLDVDLESRRLCYVSSTDTLPWHLTLAIVSRCIDVHQCLL